VVIEVQEYAKDDNRYNNKALKHIGQQYKAQGDCYEHYPADVYAGYFIAFINIIQYGVCAAIVNVPGV